MANKANKVLVFGATGSQGKAVVNELIKQGFSVRCYVSNAQSSKEALKTVYSDNQSAFEFVEGQLADPKSIESALENVQAAFFYKPVKMYGNPAFLLFINQLIEVCVKARLPRLIYTTGILTSETLLTNATTSFLNTLKQEADAITTSAQPSVILRPGFFLNNLQWPMLLREMDQEGTLSYPPVDSSRKISWISLEDQAKFVVASISNDSVLNSQLDIASIKPASGAEIAEQISDAARKLICFEPSSIEGFSNVVGTLLESDEAAIATEEYFEEANQADESALVLDTSRAVALLQVLPQPIEQWIRKQNWHTQDNADLLISRMPENLDSQIKSKLEAIFEGAI